MTATASVAFSAATEGNLAAGGVWVDREFANHAIRVLLAGDGAGYTDSLRVAEMSGEGRNRTGDTTVFSRVLYQLSYLAARRTV